MTQKDAEAKWVAYKGKKNFVKSEKYKEWAAKDAEFRQALGDLTKEIFGRREAIKRELNEQSHKLQEMKRQGLTTYNAEYVEEHDKFLDIQCRLQLRKLEYVERFEKIKAHRLETRRQFEEFCREINADLKARFTEIMLEYEHPESVLAVAAE